MEWASIPSAGDVPDPGTEPGSPALQADSLPAELQGKPPRNGGTPLIHFPIKQRSKIGKLQYWKTLKHTVSPFVLYEIEIVNGAESSLDE